MTALTDIANANWQFALGNEGVVTGLDDLTQAITIILTTPRGSVPHRPDFGSDIHLFLDPPVNLATPNLVRETFDALRQWEPRIAVKGVQVQVTGAAVAMMIRWQLSDGIPITSVVPIK